MKRTAKARTKAPQKPARPKTSKASRLAMLREVTPLYIALAVVDKRPSLDADGVEGESIWVEFARDYLRELPKADRQLCLQRGSVIINLMTAWGGE